MSANSMYQACIPKHSSMDNISVQIQMAQHLQPCKTVLYSCFFFKVAYGYITPLLMFVYTVDNSDIQHQGF